MQAKTSRLIVVHHIMFSFGFYNAYIDYSTNRQRYIDLLELLKFCQIMEYLIGQRVGNPSHQPRLRGGIFGKELL